MAERIAEEGTEMESAASDSWAAGVIEVTIRNRHKERIRTYRARNLNHAFSFHDPSTDVDYMPSSLVGYDEDWARPPLPQQRGGVD